MKHQYLLLDGEVLEVCLVRRPDGTFEDTLSGMIYSPMQLERGSLFDSREAALKTRIARVATPGYYPAFGPYTPIQH